jgi:hypothetical protein
MRERDRYIINEMGTFRSKFISLKKTKKIRILLNIFIDYEFSIITYDFYGIIIYLKNSNYTFLFDFFKKFKFKFFLKIPT